MTDTDPVIKSEEEEEEQPLHVFTVDGKVVKAYKSCIWCEKFEINHRTREATCPKGTFPVMGLIYRGKDCNSFVKSIRPKMALR